MGHLTLTDALLDKLTTAARKSNQSVESLLEFLLSGHPLSPIPSPNVLKLIAYALIVVDEHQTIVGFDAGAERLFGYQAAEVLGHPLDILLPEQDVQDHRVYFAEFVTSPEDSRPMAAHRTVKAKRSDGTLFPIEASILKYTDGQQFYYAAVLRDITQQENTLKQLHEREIMLNIVMEHAADFVALHKPDGTFMFASPSSEKITGYASNELIGKNPYDYFHPEDFARIQASHNTSLSGEVVGGTVYRYRRKNGEYIWFETLTNPVLNVHGEVEHLVTFSRDISDHLHIQEELREERDLLKGIMETSPSGIILMDADGRIVYANRRAEEILGFSQEAITQRRYDTPAWHPEDFEGDALPYEKLPFVQIMQTKQPVWDIHHTTFKQNGAKVYLSVNGAPVLDENGEVSKLVFTVEDYTQRKFEQDQLEAALSRERMLNELKSNFITLVSHEFRTPMAVIMTSTSLIRMKFGIMSQADLFTRLDRIDKQIAHLSHLISDVTFINKDDTVGHQAHPAPMNLQQFLTQIADEAQQAHPDHVPVKILGDTTCNAVALDPSLMQHIFVNLFSNALKYSASDTSVTCEYTCDGSQLMISVQDQGIGIPVENQGQLFDEFFRADNVGTISGTGLGLAIVKRAVDVMHGTIAVDSAVGSGTKFTITLPLENPTAD